MPTSNFCSKANVNFAADAHGRFWPSSTFAAAHQFVCSWGQTGLVIDRPDRALLTRSGSGVCVAAVEPMLICVRGSGSSL